MERPLHESGLRPVSAKGIDAFLHLPDGATQTLSWAATREEWRDGVVTIGTPGLSLRYRVDEPVPVRLRHDADLSLTNSFDFTYNETKAVAGRTLSRVAAVDRASYLDVKTHEAINADVAGAFDLRFTATCSADDDGCARPGEIVDVRLDGRFPIRSR